MTRQLGLLATRSKHLRLLDAADDTSFPVAQLVAMERLFASYRSLITVYRHGGEAPLRLLYEASESSLQIARLFCKHEHDHNTVVTIMLVAKVSAGEDTKFHTSLLELHQSLTIQFIIF